MRESGTGDARALWTLADRRVSSRLIVPEAWSAVTRASRVGRAPAVNTLVVRIGTRLADLEVVELTAALAAEAGRVARAFGLRGYDAVHLASALALQDETLVLATWDEELASAAAARGLAVAGATPRRA